MAEKTIELTHYRDGSKYVLGDATITNSPDGLRVAAMIDGSSISGVVQANIEIDELEFPQKGLAFDDPRKMMNFMAKLARDHHKGNINGA